MPTEIAELGGILVDDDIPVALPCWDEVVFTPVGFTIVVTPEDEARAAAEPPPPPIPDPPPPGRYREYGWEWNRSYGQGGDFGFNTGSSDRWITVILCVLLGLFLLLVAMCAGIFSNPTMRR